jgi:hypothetical protein
MRPTAACGTSLDMNKCARAYCGGGRGGRLGRGRTDKGRQTPALCRRKLEDPVQSSPHTRLDFLCTISRVRTRSLASVQSFAEFSYRSFDHREREDLSSCPRYLAAVGPF